MEDEDYLTHRQLEVAELCANYTYAEIGDMLGISERTAKAHADIVRQKLGVKHKRQIGLALRALDKLEASV